MQRLLEILTAKKWMISPDYLHGIQSALENNLNGHLAFSKDETVHQRIFTQEADGKISELCYSAEDGSVVEGSWYADEVTVPFFNVLNVSGPITRNGGGCSMGSIDYRDMMMIAASNKLCMGHIFVINTPGGSAWAKNDFEQAIEFARSQGQPVIAFIDGMCCSAGMYLAALCDERYYMNPKNEIGCIGVMAAFYTEKSGEKNQYTNKTYHELYDPESFEKNKAFRDIAQDDDSSALVEELAQLGVEFRADVKKRCVNATEEHLHGDVFNAEDVEGILVDGRKDLPGCMERIREIRQQNPVVIGAGVQMNSNSNSTISMENYPLTQSALGVEELQVTEEGTFVNAELLDTLEQNLQHSADEVAQLQEQVATLTQERDDAQAQVSEQNGTVGELNGNVETLNARIAELEAAAEESNNQIQALNTQLEEAQAAIATAEQTIADRDATIAELTAEPAEQEEQESPENNGSQVQEPTMVVGAPKYNPALTPKENADIMEAYKAGLKQKISQKKSL